MQLPIVSPAPLVTEHAQTFRHLFSDYRQFQHFENYLTGLIVLENKSLANIFSQTGSPEAVRIKTYTSNPPAMPSKRL